MGEGEGGLPGAQGLKERPKGGGGGGVVLEEGVSVLAGVEHFRPSKSLDYMGLACTPAPPPPWTESLGRAGGGRAPRKCP